MSLLDKIRQNSQLSGALQQPPQDETQKAANLLRARSGKAVAGPGMATGNLAEASAVDQTQQELQQVQQNTNLQNQDLQQQQSAQQQQSQIQNQDIAQTRNFNTIQNKMKTTELLNNLQQNRDKLDVQQSNAALQQIGANLRLTNQQYIDNLNREAARNRIDIGSRFAEEYAKSAFDNNSQLSQNKRMMDAVITGNDREFQKANALMTTGDAYSMFRSQANTDRDKALWTSVGAGTTAGVGAWNTYANKSPTTPAAQGSANPPPAQSGQSFSDYWSQNNSGK